MSASSTLKVPIPLSYKSKCVLSGSGIEGVDAFRHRYKSTCVYRLGHDGYGCNSGRESILA
jgi:hypothetical protein